MMRDSIGGLFATAEDHLGQNLYNRHSVFDVSRRFVLLLPMTASSQRCGGYLDPTSTIILRQQSSLS